MAAEVLVGLDAPDDAAVYAWDGERALVSTVDFFTPIVDDAYTFGAITAANALSDPLSSKAIAVPSSFPAPPR